MPINLAYIVFFYSLLQFLYFKESGYCIILIPLQAINVCIYVIYIKLQPLDTI